MRTKVNLQGAVMPLGVSWGSAEAGIKKPGRLDVGLIACERPAAAAAVFTRNLFCAAPVTVGREVLRETGGMVSGVVVNSGCANAATGEAGMANARAMAGAARRACGADGAFLPCSTGTIGVQLPMDRLAAGVEAAARGMEATAQGFHGFSRCILTTDTHEKLAWESFEAGGRVARIVGCAKGSGMIHPDMATLLAFVATDVEAAPDLLLEIFRRAVNRSLNCLTVDGDTSTNDTAIVLASGGSGMRLQHGSEAALAFEAKLTGVTQSLARQLARDGEGATKLVEICVRGAKDFASARTVGLTIARSPLVKTAIYGRDANWGRILCAAGYSGVALDPQKVSLRMGPLLLFENGAPVAFEEDEALVVLGGEEVRIELDLGGGSSEATVWTCDLTEKYIEINGSYRT